jgi:hypothetical protein
MSKILDLFLSLLIMVVATLFTSRDQTWINQIPTAIMAATRKVATL